MGGKDDMRDPRFKVMHNGDELSLVTRTSDGQMLFLANMVAKMNHNTPLGIRIAEVHNGSSLFTGDAGQGESNIRRWIIENDWLEAIVALPLNLFSNTGIATYIWVLSNRKPKKRKGQVQLIDASQWFKPLRKNLGKGGKSAATQPAPLDGLYEVLIAGKKSVVEYETDSDLRDSEQIPLLEEGGIETFIRREVLPYTPDAWVKKDATKIGYEVSFTRHFYQPPQLRTLAQISTDILALEQETEGLLIFDSFGTGSGADSEKCLLAGRLQMPHGTGLPWGVDGEIN